MCGLAGFWSPSLPDDMEVVLRAMTDTIAHRGPDADGFFVDTSSGIALGHRRLAIIDMSPAGAQPMASRCERYQLAYNGELYNHLELRRQLSEECGREIHWRGHSDTETLLEAFAFWGVEAALHKLNGMYAIAFWDRRDQCLHLVRDRFGEKPLYYGRVGKALVFGSELRALRVFPGWKGDISSEGLAKFLRYGHIPAPSSIYSGIVKLPPAHWVTIQKPEQLPEPNCYWSVREVAESSYNPEIVVSDKLLDDLDALLETTVHARMLSDVPLGAFLSGGVDSSLIVSYMQRASSTPVKTFAIGFEEPSHDESPFARAVAKHLGTSHTEHIVTSQESLDFIPDICKVWDEPFADASQIPTYLVSKLAKAHVTVSLTGDGGDELFAGYNRYAHAARMLGKIEKAPPPIRKAAGRVIDMFAPGIAGFAASYNTGIQSVVPKLDRLAVLSGYLTAESDDDLYEYFLTTRSLSKSLLNREFAEESRHNVPISQKMPFEERILQRDILHYLPDDVLVKVDRAGMALSLETRAPFLDPHLAQFAMSLSWNVKRHNGVGKWPLLTVLKRYVPGELVERRKTGFGVPIAEWLRGPLLPWAEELLSEADLKRSGMFDVAVLRNLWSLHKSRRMDLSTILWNVLMFQSWWHEYEE